MWTRVFGAVELTTWPFRLILASKSVGGQGPLLEAGDEKMTMNNPLFKSVEAQSDGTTHAERDDRATDGI